MASWNVILAIITFSVSFKFIFSFWRVRKHPSILVRNPPLTIASALGSSSNSIIMLLVLPSPHSMCHLKFLSMFSLSTLHCAPIILRGFQYLVLTNDLYRRKYSRLKSNRFIFKNWLSFFLINCVVLEALYWVFYRSNCMMTWDAIYAILMLFMVLYFSSKLSLCISWNSDAFKIAKELKICYSSWGVCGLLAIACGIGGNFVTSKKLRSLPYLFLIGNNYFTFIITIIAPLYHSKVYKRMLRNFKLCTPVFIRNTFIPEQQQENRTFSWMESKCRQIVEQRSLKTRRIRDRSLNTLTVPTNQSGSFAHLDCFEQLLNDREATMFFHDYCRQHFVPEISLFYEAVHEYKQDSRNEEPREIFKKYQKIVKDFVNEGSPYEINVCSKVRDEILVFGTSLDQFLCLSKHVGVEHIFDTAQRGIAELFERNFGERFWVRVAALGVKSANTIKILNPMVRVKKVEVLKSKTMGL